MLALQDGHFPVPLSNEEHKELWQLVCDGIPGLRELKPGKEMKEPKMFELWRKAWTGESQYDTKGFVPMFASRWACPYVISVFDKHVYKLRSDPESGCPTHRQGPHQARKTLW